MNKRDILTLIHNLDKVEYGKKFLAEAVPLRGSSTAEGPTHILYTFEREEFGHNVSINRGIAEDGTEQYDIYFYPRQGSEKFSVQLVPCGIVLLDFFTEGGVSGQIKGENYNLVVEEGGRQ